MMEDSPKRAIKEAERWLISAKNGLKAAEKDPEVANVCCAQAIHAIIRANDALCIRFLGIKMTRHDDAAIAFAKLLKQGKLPTGSGKLKELVANAMKDKSGADYGKDFFSCERAESYVRHAEDFIKMAKDAI